MLKTILYLFFVLFHKSESKPVNGPKGCPRVGTCFEKGLYLKEIRLSEETSGDTMHLQGILRPEGAFILRESKRR